jgi:hypothetical protein
MLRDVLKRCLMRHGRQWVRDLAINHALVDRRRLVLAKLEVEK